MSEVPIVDNKPQIPPQLGKFVIGPLEQALYSGYRRALETGVEPEMVINSIANGLASVIAAIQNPSVRLESVECIVEGLGKLVSAHVEEQRKTRSGLITRVQPGEIGDFVR